MSMSDDFSSRFDSIPVEKASMFADAPSEADPLGPGFTLLDDAGGRFTIERETGIITLLHDETLTTDAGRVFSVRLRCVEFSGLTYTQTVQLRLTGRVPLIVGDEVNDALSRLAQGPIDAAPVAPMRRMAMTESAPVPATPWPSFAAFSATPARRPLAESGAFGALVAVELPPVQVSAALALTAELPAPAPAYVSWTL